MSYDSVDVLSGFGGKYGIQYPLLSDQGSAVIRALGLLNEQAAEQVAGIPHPGTFVLNGDGTVRSKHFYESYRERDTGTGVLEHILGLDHESPAAPAQATQGGIEIRAWLDKNTYSWGQRLWLNVELDIPEGLHVYGSPIPDGYYPLAVDIEPVERVVVGALHFPEAQPFRVEGLDEAFVVYEGKIRVTAPITFMVVDAGPVELKLRVSFQACTATDCLMPESTSLSLSVLEEPLVERPKPKV